RGNFPQILILHHQVPLSFLKQYAFDHAHAITANIISINILPNTIDFVNGLLGKNYIKPRSWIIANGNINSLGEE
ncbi:MAG: hypothetical protein FWE85_03375, partial [Clostridiales bacterium]|nr:hypothetical protein [Clostridiales bacterium]